MIKQEGVFKEKHSTRHFAENQGDGRRAFRGAGPCPHAWPGRTALWTLGHLEPISIMSGIL